MTRPLPGSPGFQGAPVSALERRFSLPVLAGWAAVLVGCAVLLGWAVGSEPLKRILPGYPSMKPNTAICFILLGWSFLSARSPEARTRVLGMAGSLGAVAVGLATLVEYMGGRDFGFDHFLFPESGAVLLTPFEGRMGANTALAFIALGVALAALALSRFPSVVEGGAISAIAVAELASLRYLYGAKPFSRFALASSQIAFHTVLLLLILGFGVLWSAPQGRVRRLLSSAGPGGTASRRLLPIVFVTLVGLGWIRLKGQQAGFYGLELGLSFMVCMSLAVLTAGILWLAGVLERLDEERQIAEETRRAIETRFKAEREAELLKRTFIANMSHELRTPLNAILGFSELIEDGKAGPTSSLQREFMGDILTSSRHLLALINDILDIAKLDSGKASFRCELLSLPLVTQEVLSVLRSLTTRKHLQVETDFDPAVCELELDPDRLKQVLFNYLSNAIRFTPRGGRITVRARPEASSRFRLEVEDNGVGIRQEKLGELFQEFRQVHRAGVTEEPGTGLGLALTKRLVEAQGGSVGARSVEGLGSVFFAILPCSLRPALASS
jgi:signal transduction histidine kinase